MAGKRGGRRHSTTSFSESVVVAGTSYQMCNRRFSILQSGEVLTSVNNDNSANFSGEKSTMINSVCLFFDNTRKNLRSNLVLESEGLYWFCACVVEFPRW